jgi:hypothetical protein
MNDTRARVELRGSTPLSDNAELIRVRYVVGDIAAPGASCRVKPANIVINGGVEFPEPVANRGIFVLGGSISYSWMLRLDYIGDEVCFWTAFPSERFPMRVIFMMKALISSIFRLVRGHLMHTSFLMMQESSEGMSVISAIRWFIGQRALPVLMAGSSGILPLSGMVFGLTAQ